MKKTIFLLVVLVLFMGMFKAGAGTVSLGLEKAASDISSTDRNDTSGKEIWTKFKSKEINCKDFTDKDFENLGEYFTGVMMGSSREAMDTLRVQMMGEEGEKQMQIVMGKRLSGCDTQASFSTESRGFVPMMNMMGSWPNQMSNYYSNNKCNFMMTFGSFAFFGIIFIIFWWILIIAGIVVLVRWLWGLRMGGLGKKSALDILKERYAKGEIEREEFEEKKKDLM